jgi:hypothetical protein
VWSFTWGRSHQSQQSLVHLFLTFTFDCMRAAHACAACHPAGIPPGMWINYLTWSPKSTYLAFTLRSAGREGDPPRCPLELWVADVATGQARKLLEQPLNVVFDE